MSPIDIIRKKRDGERLTTDELAAIARGAADGSIADYQLSAWLMAVFLRGLDPHETADLTRSMLATGATFRWSPGPPCVDKHSTGGVGDKVSLVLAPLLACCGMRVPMISGRGLGATGGTLDKLEALRGFRTNLSTAEMQSVCDRVGCVISGATGDLVPADKKLYALRDVTATVASIPLITASIMSKKLAEGLDALVLDVKWGSGAFMSRQDDARALARSMVEVGRLMGLKTVALLTDMNQPLGRMCGHANELRETFETLAGRGPADLLAVTLALGAELLVAVGLAGDVGAARARLQQALDDGRGLAKWREMIVAQGGDPDTPLSLAPEVLVTANAAGYVDSIQTEQLGRAIAVLGGGRVRVSDTIDFRVGLEMLVRLGQRVERDQPLVRVFAGQRGRDEALSLIRDAVHIGAEPIATPALIVERIA